MRWFTLSALGILLWSCASHGRPGSSILQPPSAGRPFVNQTGAVNGWQTFFFSTVRPWRMAPVAGHDGNEWVLGVGDGLHKISMSGSETTYTPTLGIEQLIRNPDGNFYTSICDQFNNCEVNRITTDGQVTTIASGVGLTSMISGSDGNLWGFGIVPGGFGIVRMQTSGTYSVFPWDESKLGSPAQPYTSVSNIFRGADKNLWVWASGPHYSNPVWVRISVTDGSTTAFPVPPGLNFGFTSVFSDCDGVLWIYGGYDNGPSHTMYRFDPITKGVTVYNNLKGALPNSFGYIACTKNTVYWRGYRELWAWDTTLQRVVAKYTVPSVQVGGEGADLGPDGQIWTVNELAYTGNYVSVQIIHPLVPTPSSITVATGSSTPLTMKEPKTQQNQFTAVSNDPTIATVSGAGASFKVYGVAPGSTTITVSDQIGNSLDVSVTVN